MGYVQTTDNEVDNLSGLGIGPTPGGITSMGIRGYWANNKLKAVVQGYSNRRPSGVFADWKFFTIQAQAQAYATGAIPPPVVVKPPSGGGGTVTPPPPGKPPVPYKPPTGGGGTVLPPVPYRPPTGGGGGNIGPGIPPEVLPGGSNYRFENGLAYPLTIWGANNKPLPLTRTAGYAWTKKIFPIEKFGFVWEWKFVPAPAEVVIGPPIVYAPPPVGGTSSGPGGDRPNVVQPPPGGNVYKINANEPAGQYYNITTGEVRTGRKLQKMPTILGSVVVSQPGYKWDPNAGVPPGGISGFFKDTWGAIANQFWSWPPDDNGNWILRDEAVRRGYISMTGNAGIQVNPNIPTPGGLVMPGVPSDQEPKPTQAGMSPWLIGGLVIGALLLFSRKAK